MSMKGEKIAYFIVSHNDEQTLQTIREECPKGLITPHIVYHGDVPFRTNGSIKNILSFDKLVYANPIVQSGIIPSVVASSVNIQHLLMTCIHPLVGCVNQGQFKSVMKSTDFIFTEAASPALIVYENCPFLHDWITAFTRYCPYKSNLKRHHSIADVIKQLQGAV